MTSASFLNRLVTAGLYAIIVLAPTQYSLEMAPKVYLCIVDPLVWLVAMGWVLDALRGRHWRSLRPPPAATMCFLAMTAASVASAVSRTTVLKDLFQYVEYFAAAYLLFDRILNREQRIRTAALTFLGVGSVVVGLTAIQYFTPSVEGFRVAGTFGNRNVLGGYLALLLPFAFGLLLHDAQNWKRAAWLGLLVLIGGVTCLSGGALLALAVAGLVMAALRGRTALACTVLVLLSCVLLLPRILPRNNGSDLYASVALHDDSGQVVPRYTEWQAAADMALDNPILGVGAGNYQLNVGSYYGILPDPAGRKLEADSQNLYLVIASSLGLPGLLAFAAMLLTGIADATRNACRAPSAVERGIALGSVGALVAFSIAAVWSPLLVRGIGVPLAFVLALSHKSGWTDG